MPEIKEVVYSSKIIKAGALIADTKTLLTHWDLSISVTENVERFRRDNIFGKDCGKEVVTISPAELLWEAIAAAEGLDSIVELEREQGFEAAQEQVNIYLSDQDWCPLPDLLAQRLKALDPQRHIVFLLRSASMAPAIYQMSKLLDEMQGKTRIATILGSTDPLMQNRVENP